MALKARHYPVLEAATKIKQEKKQTGKNENVTANQNDTTISIPNFYYNYCVVRFVCSEFFYFCY